MRTPLLLNILLVCTLCQPKADPELYSRSWTDADRTYLLAGLDSTLNMILEKVAGMDEDQWNRQSDPNRWSAALIVEHLITHDELFYREVRVLTGLPEMPPVPDSLFSTDDRILSYSEINDRNRGTAPSYLEPLGRWCTKEDALNAYSRVRNALIRFVQTTDKDLRRYYTSSGRGPTQYRDLHQLLLISISHTARHYEQLLGH